MTRSTTSKEILKISLYVPPLKHFLKVLSTSNIGVKPQDQESHGLLREPASCPDSGSLKICPQMFKFSFLKEVKLILPLLSAGWT